MNREVNHLWLKVYVWGCSARAIVLIQCEGFLKETFQFIMRLPEVLESKAAFFVYMNCLTKLILDFSLLALLAIFVML